MSQDCRLDLTPVFPEQFDVITNIGFTEHVGEGDVRANVWRHQYTIFRSIHNLGRVGSLLYHDFVVVAPAHGVVNYRLPFIYALAERCNYSFFFEPYEHNQNSLATNSSVYLAAYRKEADEPFMSFEEFSKLPGLVPIHDTYGNYRHCDIYLKDSQGVNRFVMSVEQDFESDDWRGHATVLCGRYFASTPADSNVYLARGENYCVDHVGGVLEHATIEHAIAN